MDPKTRSLIELLRDETQSRSVFDRCNEVLAAADAPLFVHLDAESGLKAWSDFFAKGGVIEFDGRDVGIVHATEAEVQIIMGEKR